MQVAGGFSGRAVATWLRPRSAMRGVLAMRPREAVILAFAMIAMLFIFIARTAKTLGIVPPEGATTEAMVGAQFVTLVLFAPLFLYGFAALLRLVFRLTGGQGGWYETRLATFWALMVTAPAHGVAAIIEELDAKLVVTWSQRGGGARYLSKSRLFIPIIAASSDDAALRRMTLLFGVIPVHMDMPASREVFAQQIDRIIQQRHWAAQGDPIILAAGEPIGVPGVTNTLWLRYLGDVCTIE